MFVVKQPMARADPKTQRLIGMASHSQRVNAPPSRPSSTYDHLLKLLIIGDSGTLAILNGPSNIYMCVDRCGEELPAA